MDLSLFLQDISTPVGNGQRLIFSDRYEKFLRFVENNKFIANNEIVKSIIQQIVESKTSSEMLKKRAAKYNNLLL